MIKLDYSKKAVVDTATGRAIAPACWDDLVAYHAYLEGNGNADFAQEKLCDVLHGRLVMTELRRNLGTIPAGDVPLALERDGR